MSSFKLKITKNAAPGTRDVLDRIKKGSRFGIFAEETVMGMEELFVECQSRITGVFFLNYERGKKERR